MADKPLALTSANQWSTFSLSFFLSAPSRLCVRFLNSFAPKTLKAPPNASPFSCPFVLFVASSSCPSASSAPLREPVLLTPKSCNALPNSKPSLSDDYRLSANDVVVAADFTGLRTAFRAFAASRRSAIAAARACRCARRSSRVCLALAV